MEKSDFYGNVGGLNLTDSPFYVNDSQATNGFNFEYLKTGGLTKRRGHLKVNTVADSVTRTLGMGVKITKENVRTVLRATDSVLETVNIDAGTFTALTTDTATPTSTIFTSGSTQPVVFANFNTPTLDMIWVAGGGVSTLTGYNGTKLTTNGVPAPTGTFSGVVSLTGGSWTTTGTYYYAIALRKTQTQSLSNADLDFSAVIANVTDKVTITLPSGIDTTKYDKFYIYRSAVGGVTDFTTGVLVAQVNTTEVSYVDTGSSLTSIDNVPRDGNAILDNGVLPSGTYNTVVVWKNQLVTATGNTVYFSDILKPESWPADKNIPIANGGKIMALGVVNFNSRSSANNDEYLVVWTANRMYLIQGSGTFDFNLDLWDLEVRFLDTIGCVGQSSIVNCYGNIMWVDSSGIYAWDATGKPLYVSRPIEAFFNNDGDFDKAKSQIVFGTFFRKQKQVHWFFPHRIYGENKISFVLDGRLTFMAIGSGEGEATVSNEGVFTSNSTDQSFYGGTAYIVDGSDEYFLLGDDEGFVYNALRGASDDTVDSTAGIDFDYYTKWIDFGTPGIAKTFHKVVAWVETSVPEDLTLEFWSSYKIGDSNKSVLNETLDTKDRSLIGSLWDLAFWDDATWDSYEPYTKPIVFNLPANKNNNSGDSLRLRFRQSDPATPLIILGFSVYWDVLGTRK